MKYVVTFMCVVLAFSLAGGIFGISAGATFTGTLHNFTDSVSWFDNNIVDPTLWVLNLFGIDFLGGIDDLYNEDIIFTRRTSEDLLRFTEIPDRDFSSVEYAVYIDVGDLPMYSAFSYWYMSVDPSFSHADYFAFYFDVNGVLLSCVMYNDHERMDAGTDVTRFFETSFLNVYSRELVLCLNTWYFPFDEDIGDTVGTSYVQAREWKDGICEYYPSWWIFDWS